MTETKTLETDVLIEDVSYDDFPARMKESFNYNNAVYHRGSLNPHTDTISCKKIIFPNKDVLFSVELASKNINARSELITYLFEENWLGGRIGEGKIFYANQSDEEDLKEKPYVGFTKTEPMFGSCGYGIRRLLAMNHLAQMQYNLPMFSGDFESTLARNSWSYLEDAGLVSRFQDLYGERFRFK